MNFLLPLLLACSPHRFYIAPDVYYRDYDEDLTPPAKSHEYGWLSGLQIGYDYQNPCDLYWGLEARASWGPTVYDGSTTDLQTLNTSPYQGTTYNDFYMAEGREGYTFCSPGGGLYSLFAGLGVQAWRRNLVSFREDYSWWYFALGTRIEYPFDEEWAVGLHLKIMQTFAGVMTSSDLSDAIFNLGSAFQYEIEAPITYRLPRAEYMLDQLSFVPYFRSLNLIHSNVQYEYVTGSGWTGFQEPSSTTKIFGVRLEAVKYF